MKESKKIYVYLLIYSAIIATAITFCEKYFANNFLLSVLIPAGVATVVGGAYSLVEKKKEKNSNSNDDSKDTRYENQDVEVHEKEYSKQKETVGENVNNNYYSLDENKSQVVDKPKVFVKKR